MRHRCQSSKSSHLRVTVTQDSVLQLDTRVASTNGSPALHVPTGVEENAQGAFVSNAGDVGIDSQCMCSSNINRTTHCGPHRTRAPLWLFVVNLLTNYILSWLITPARRQLEPWAQYGGWNRGQGSAAACDCSTRCTHSRARLAHRRWSADKLSFVAFWGCGDVSRSGWHAISKNGRGEMRTAWVEVREGPAASPEISQVV